MHFAIMVIGNNPDEILAPYDEGIEVTSCIPLREKDKQDFLKYYKEKHPDKQDKSFEELYELFGNDWNANSWDKNFKGEWVEISTCNPYGKWDWYVFGGRFENLYILKEGTDPEFITKKDIDVEAMQQKAIEFYTPLYDFITKENLSNKNKEDYINKNTVYKEEDLKIRRELFNKYKKQTIVKRFLKWNNERNTFTYEDLDLFVKDKEKALEKMKKRSITPYGYVSKFGWVEKYDKNLFKPEETWEDHFTKLFESLDDNTVITIADCHI
jgi:hypothetical protein